MNESGTGVGVFRVSGTVDDKEYTDFWGADGSGQGRRLFSREERK